MKKEIKENYSLYLGDNIQWLKTLQSDSIDSVVTDPPYGLSFMGKKWDYDVPSMELWNEVFRVLKPGGHILSFGGTRTYHRMVTNIENAGFEIRDQLQWLFFTGFPKSHNIGKAIDKIQGNEREVIGSTISGISKAFTKEGWGNGSDEVTKTKGMSIYDAWGTGLKPANEPICLARKPISERTIALNVIKHGTGGINIDGCRIEYTSSKDEKHQQNIRKGIGKFFGGAGKSICFDPVSTGRFPSNVLIDESIGEILDEQGGIKNQGHWSSTNSNGFGEFGGGKSTYYGTGEKDKSKIGASKFFYVPKPSKKEKSMGLDQISNSHPTVKPITLISYLVRLITPPGGTVLDPYMGSGSGGISTLLEGFKFIGMEQDPDYFEIATARIKEYESYREILIKPKKPKREIVIVEKDLEIGEPVSTFWLNQAI